MTNSKDYEKQKSLNNAKEAPKDTEESTDDSLKTVKHTTSRDSNIEYVPAEYFRGAENGSIQTGNIILEPYKNSWLLNLSVSVSFWINKLCEAWRACKWEGPYLHDPSTFLVIVRSTSFNFKRFSEICFRITTSTTMPTVANETTTANTNGEKDHNRNEDTNGHSEPGQNGHGHDKQ